MTSRPPTMSAEEFKSLCSQLGWTKAELARRLGMSRWAIIRYETEGAPQNIANHMNDLVRLYRSPLIATALAKLEATIKRDKRAKR